MPRAWPVVLVVVLQLGALALLPLRSARARAGGREITLRTQAVDPFDPLAGRYIVLRYAAERPDQELPYDTFEEGQGVWIVIEESAPAWLGARIAAAHEPATSARLSLRATWRRGRAELEGAGRFYLNEEQCLAADELLSQAPDEGLVDLAVDERGNVSPLRLHIAGRVFEP